MKPWFKLAVIPAFVLAVTACQQKEEKTDKAADAPVKLETDQSKQAYAIGASIAEYISKTMTKQEELGIKLDKELVVAGFTDGIHGKNQLDKKTITAQLQALDKEASEKMAAKAKAEAEKNKAAGEKYLADNAKKEGVKVTASGLQYEVLKEGTGEHPKATDKVTVNYKGTLIDGTQFDSSYDRGEPITFALNRVIPGWTEGVQLMTVGSKYRFVIPANLAYGERDMQTIPPNSTLVFEVELLGIGDQKPADKTEDAKKTEAAKAADTGK
ncbi:FKBP-type peptidyl-prolyl cis-trans isomerase [Gallaecimonas kandeliae]|uniref:FKBP-type peptidyl-prolyl cis-trans isomerase n=1 Tax=Gallaecimonas kandeliae TaxID=3029055 RepID=UPI002647D888|nr:FKBP-type peptidyl-prolyl cis-trans isomerase [Gallaecimonas kandeliae]WKE65186.1 FKBP-type peptidyl-prolyl cis-trans isomerase [Gallaecimonas kandeliae]